MINPTDIIAFESGDLSLEDSAALFQALINSGQAWVLPGFYGRAAQDLIAGGWCVLGPRSCRDAYGNTVPSRDQIDPGAPGSVLYAEELNDEFVLRDPTEEIPQCTASTRPA